MQLRYKSESKVLQYLWCGYHMTKTVVGSIMVVGALTHCALLHLVCDLKAALMNVQCSLIKKLMLYKFSLGHKATEATKIICYAKGDGAVGHSSVIWWSKKFCLVCFNLNDRVGLKLLFLRLCSKPQRQIWQESLRDYQASLASHSCPVWFNQQTHMFGAPLQLLGRTSTSRGVIARFLSGMTRHWRFLWPWVGWGILPGVRLIAWRLRHPSLGECRRDPRYF